VGRTRLPITKARVSSQEEILQTHPDVTESAVFGIKDELKGQLPFGFVVVGKHIEDKPEEFARVERECINLVRKELGPVAAFKMCKVIYRLPKTRSGKTLRGTMSKIADGEEYNVCSRKKGAARNVVADRPCGRARTAHQEDVY
jgi:acyl-coenzyme A synthetase/AMP-(fatty) acid ligase